MLRAEDRKFGVSFPGFGVAEVFLFSTASRPTLGSTQPPIKLVTDVLSPGVNRTRREADHYPPYSADVKNS
jgi:hypothetical protein